MAIADLQAYAICLEETSGTLQAAARRELGLPNPCLELAATAFPAPELGVGGADIFIAPADDPGQAAPWSSKLPLPPGYVTLSPAQTRKSRSGFPVFISDDSRNPIADAVNAAAVTVPEKSPPGAVARRPPRERVQRPRPPRRARAPRLARPARSVRPPRPPRKPRTPRPARPARKSRTNGTKGKGKIGVCTGPQRTELGYCWTPGGCLASTAREYLDAGRPVGCLQGPCLGDGSCVSGACANTPADLLVSSLKAIVDFWSLGLVPASAKATGIVSSAVKDLASLRLLPLPQPAPLGKGTFPQGYHPKCPCGAVGYCWAGGCDCRLPGCNPYT